MKNIRFFGASIAVLASAVSGQATGAQPSNAVPPVAEPAPASATAAETAVPDAVAARAPAVAETAAPLDKKALAAREKERRQAETAEKRRLADLKRKYGEGPYPAEVEAFVGSKPAVLQPLYKTLYTGGERNAVLNFERLGMVAMQQGLWADAEAAFDGALLRIETIYAKNKQAEAARSVFHNEANKDFKGEPYERAMAYYYRGLLYLRAGDYDNARASFRSAEYQDTISEVESFKSDFAVMNYLTGWTYHCQGSKTSASEAFAAARASAPDLPLPSGDDTQLLIAEVGSGPVKARGGTQMQKLIFNPGTGSAPLAGDFDLGAAKLLAPVEASSVYFQATTRGGRPIDGTLQGKAEFKETTQMVGNVAMQTGLLQLQSGGDTGAGAGLAAMGMVFSLFSSAAKTQADIRGWDNLPDKIFLAVAKSGGAERKVRYLAGGQTGTGASPQMLANGGKCSIGWFNARAVEPVSPEIPGEDKGVAAAVARKPAIQLKDKAFRAALSSNAPQPTSAQGGSK